MRSSIKATADRAANNWLRAAPAPVGGVCCLDLQAGFGALALERFEHAFLVVTVQPGHRGVASQVCKRRRAHRLGRFGLAVKAR